LGGGGAEIGNCSDFCGGENPFFFLFNIILFSKLN
jgi:hypothetical protein